MITQRCMYSTANTNAYCLGIITSDRVYEEVGVSSDNMELSVLNQTFQ